MIAEPTAATYSDQELSDYAERYPIPDENGIEKDESAVPLSGILYTWIPTYDLNMVASEIWSEKASAVAACFDYSGDGNSMTRSQMFDHCNSRARFYKSRRKAVCVQAEGMSMTPELRLSQKDEYLEL